MSDRAHTFDDVERFENDGNQSEREPTSMLPPIPDGDFSDEN
jgi:hypothetical protein